MSRPSPDRQPTEAAERQPPAELAQSTVSEIAGWLVGQPLHTVERELIKQTLEACEGDRALAASLLDITLPQLRKKLTAYAVRGQPLPGAETNANSKPRAAEAQPEVPKAELPSVLEAASAGNDASEAQAADTPEEPVTAHAAAPEEAVQEQPAQEESRPSAEVHVLRLPSSEVGGGFHVPAIEAPERIDFTFAGEAAAPRPAEPEPVLAVPEPANDPEPQAVAAPAKRAARSLRLPLAAALAALMIAPIAYGLLKDTPAVTTPTALDRVQLEVSVREQPMPLEQRIAVPAWVMPPERAAQERAASAEPAPPAIAETPPAAPVIAAAPVTPEAAVFAPDTSADVAMDLAAPNSERDVAMTLTPPNSERDLAMTLTPPDMARDVAMALAPPNAERDVAMALGPVDIAADARMEPGNWQATLARAEDAPETTGSIPAATFFKAPQRAPMPVARLDPERHPVTRPAPAPAPAAAPRQAARPAPRAEETPLGQGFFPFTLFGQQPAARGAGTGAPAAYPAN